MKSILGRINVTNQKLDSSIFNKSFEKIKLTNTTKSNSIINELWGFGQVTLNTNNNFELQNSNLIFVSDSTIYNKEELAKKLGFKDVSMNDDLVILESFKKWNVDCVKYLIGDFAFAIWNIEKNELFCARDHLGVKPFNYYYNDNSFVFSSTISAILAQADLKFSINEQYIADTISIVKSEHSLTTYNEIIKLPPAHYLFLKENNLEIKQYWSLKPKQNIVKKDKEIIDEFKSILNEAVNCRIQNEKNIGAELSGGLDSSSITAIASRSNQVKTFSHVLPTHLLGKVHPFNDERTFIKSVIDYCKISKYSFITSENKSLLDDLNQSLMELLCIPQQGFGIFSYHLYQTAKEENVNVLLSGFGGDEVVTSKSLGYLTELAKENKWHELKNDLKNQSLSESKQVFTFMKFYLKSKLPFINKIIKTVNFKNIWWKGKYENLAINESFMKELNIKERFNSYYKKQENLSIQERNIERITHPHMAQRLEYCSLLARKYGLEYRYPLLDIRLIEYYLAIPARLKARNGIGRYTMRKATEGLIPEKIQWRIDKGGATIPTVYMRMINDKEKIIEIINRSKSNSLIKKYIDLDKFEQWFNKICIRLERKQKNINPGAFYNYLKLILFIEEYSKLFK